MISGIQAVALQLSTEFGYTREIRIGSGSCPIWLGSLAKVMSGSVQGVLAALVCCLPDGRRRARAGVEKAHLLLSLVDRDHPDPACLRRDDLARAAAWDLL